VSQVAEACQVKSVVVRSGGGLVLSGLKWFKWLSSRLMSEVMIETSPDLPDVLLIPFTLLILLASTSVTLHKHP